MSIDEKNVNKDHVNCLYGKSAYWLDFFEVVGCCFDYQVSENFTISIHFNNATTQTLFF